MPDAVLSPGELADRTRMATEAAFSAGTDLGLRIEETRVLHDAFSVVVHLAPSPVVARIPVVLVPGTTAEELQQRQQRELDVADWLWHEGVPVVRPSPLVEPEPVREDDFSMTLWEYVEPAEDHRPYGEADPAVCVALHAALAAYQAPLPFLQPFNDALPRMVAALEGCAELDDADLDRVHAEWQSLRPVLAGRAAFTERFPSALVQPIQGDTPSHNVIRTATGVRFADFEEVTLGPVEWDLAGLEPQAVASYDAAAEPLGLRPSDPDVLAVMEAARRLHLLAAWSLVPQLPKLGEGLRPVVDAWRREPLPVL